MASGDQGDTLAGNKENTKEDLYGILSWSTLDSLEENLVWYFAGMMYFSLLSFQTPKV